MRTCFWQAYLILSVCQVFLRLGYRLIRTQNPQKIKPNCSWCFTETNRGKGECFEHLFLSQESARNATVIPKILLYILSAPSIGTLSCFKNKINYLKYQILNAKGKCFTDRVRLTTTRSLPSGGRFRYKSDAARQEHFVSRISYAKE